MNQKDVMVEAGETTEDDPFIAYVPFAPNVTGATTQDLNSLYSEIPGLKAGSPIGTGVGTLFEESPYLGLVVENRFTVSKRVGVYAKKTDGGYKNLMTTTPYSTTVASGGSASISFTLNTLCGTSGITCYTDMNTLAGNSSTRLDSSQLLFVVAFPDDSSSIPSDISECDIEDYTNSFFVKAKMSTNYPEPTVEVSAIKRGDTNLSISYNASSVQYGQNDLFYKIVIVNSTTAVAANSSANLFSTLGTTRECATNQEIYPDNCLIMSTQINLGGDATAYNLVNGQNYKLSVVLANKFKFTSQIRQTLDGQPQEIEAFIKEQSCFFLSAGFQDQHYILDYFRTFRDSVLLKNSFGKMFVDSYYQIAPQYTHYIYNNSVISALMRGLGYLLFWVIQGIAPLICFALALMAHRRLKRIHL